MKGFMTFYPNDVIYNISVDGFIRCLVEMYGYEEIFQWLDDDGTLNIPIDFIDRIFEVEKNKSAEEIEKVEIWELTKAYTELTREMLRDPKPNPEDILRSLFASNKTKYPNVFASKEQRDGKRIIYYFQKYFDMWGEQKPVKGLNCAFCGEKFIPSDIISKNSISTSNAPDVGSLHGSFPNTFWNGDPQTYLCPKCESLFLFQHLSSFEKNKFFINTNSFKLNFILNLTLKEYSKLDISSALEKALINMKTIGIWSLSNIEIIQRDYKRGFIRKTFSKRLAEAIIKPFVLNSLKRLSKHKSVGMYSLESPIDIVVEGNYEGLLYNAYKCIRADENFGRNLVLSYSALYSELSGGGNTMSTDLKTIRHETQRLSPSLQDSIFKMRFKLIEQIRVGNKDAVFGIITRIFVSYSERLPFFIIDIFEDDVNFKSYMYTLIGSVREKGGKEYE